MTLGAFLYFLLLVVWSGAVAYLLLFKAYPAMVTSAERAHEVAAAPSSAHTPPVHHAPPAPRPATSAPRAASRGYSAHEGFKSFQTGEHLTVDDLVKGLSRK